MMKAKCLGSCVSLVILAAVAWPSAAGEPAGALLSDALRRAESQPTTTDSEMHWSNLQRLPTGALLLIEQSTGKPLKGRLVSIADDALSVQQRGGVVGVARSGVARVWLLGERNVGEGALIGAAAAGIFGAILGATMSGEESGAAFAAYLGFTFGGIGAGIGAAVGSTIRERTLIYRAPRPGGLPEASTPHTNRQTLTALDSCVTQEGALTLPAVSLRNVCRNFSAEQVARGLAQELAQLNRVARVAPLPKSSETTAAGLR